MDYTMNEVKRIRCCGSKKIPTLWIGTVVLAVLCITLALVTVLVPSRREWMMSTDTEVAAPAATKPDTPTTTPETTRTTTLNPQDNEFPVVDTHCFKVEGLYSVRAFVFKGIPYAEPPVGSLRWKPPVPLESGASKKCAKKGKVFNATEFGEKCVQFSATNLSYYEGSEDCLFLNIWTPTLNSSANLPVMVYLHGGGLEVMDGNIPTYSPNEYISASSDVVFVSLNYRLNIFGFLALEILSQESPTNTSGNYGLMDQILALKWVQKNIANFGGDPSLVTLFGHSSGATAAFALLASPAAQGLFQRAWLSSGSVNLNSTLEEASEANLQFLHNTRCENTTCLYRLAPEQLIGAIPLERWHRDDLSDLPAKGRFNDPLAIADGDLLPQAPLEAWQSNNSRITVPILIGTTAQEVDDVATPDGVKSWNWTMYEDNVREKLDTFGENITQQALRLYPSGPEYDPEYQFTSMVSDVRVTCPVQIQADIMAAASSDNVYRYVVTSRPSKEVSYLTATPKPAYAFHTMDMFAFFGTLGLFINPLSEADIEFQETIQKEVLHFVRTGEVKSSSWQPFPAVTAILDNKTTVVDDYHKEQCDFWERSGFFQYAWIN